MVTALRERSLVAAVLEKFPGAQIVDVRRPALGNTEPAAYVPQASYSLLALVKAARDEANRIDDTQEALVKAGDRAAADAGQLARRDQFEAIARLLERLRGDAVILERLKAGGGR